MTIDSNTINSILESALKKDNENSNTLLGDSNIQQYDVENAIENILKNAAENILKKDFEDK